MTHTPRPHTLGIDIGTFESKGVLVDAQGRITAQASRPHKMLVPRAGWAEHRADEDWWGDFVHITKETDAGIYVSGGAEHQGPDGGGPVAVIVDRRLVPSSPASGGLQS